MTLAVMFLASGLVLSFLEARAGVLENSRWARDSSVAVDSSRSTVSLKTRSALDCAITCSHNPACLLYAWDTGVAVCYLDPALHIDTTSPTSQRIYRKIYHVMGNETATGTWTTQGTTVETTDITSTVTTPRTSMESTTTATSVTPPVAAAATTQTTASDSTKFTTSMSTYVTQTSTSTQTTLADTSTVATITAVASTTTITTTTKMECPVLVIGNGSVTWTSVSQREGSIVCDDDYMLSTDDTSVLCLSNLTWHVGGECRLRIVRNVTLNAFYPIPRAVTTGWSTCIRGTLFYSGTDSRISVKLAEDTASYNLLLMDFRVSYSGTTRQLVYNTKNNGTLDAAKVVGWTPFIVVGQNFTFKLTVKTSTNLDIFVDGTLRTNIAYGRNLLNTLYVSAAQTVTMDTIDLWC